MIERDTHKRPDTALTEPTFDFRDPNLKFETGVRITGMEAWEDISKVFAKLTNSITQDAETDEGTSIHIVRPPDFKAHIKRRDITHGFYGQSTEFGIEIISTDLSFVRPGRKTEPNPRLAKTFVLSRRIRSSALPKEGAEVLTACTVSLVDKGVFSYRNSYDDGLDRKHYFGASVGLKPVNEAALKKIKGSRKTPALVTADRQNPITKRRDRF